MEPGLTRFESEQPTVKYIHVNIDEKDKSENMELMAKYFEGKTESIPFTVLVNKEKEAVAQWVGGKSYPDLVAEISAIEAKTPE